MDPAIMAAIVVIVINVIITIFCAGKLYQKVGDFEKAMNKLERKVDNTDTHLDKLTERIATMEGKIGR